MSAAAAGERSEGKRLVAMAEEKQRSATKARSHRRRSGNKQSSALTNEDAAQRKAALEAAIRKKIEYERKALCVVERLLEEDITEEFLVDCGKFITPFHYKDAVEERSIIKLCGYPICQNRLQNVPKQKYRISTKTNKVYDITERKCFCSNFCYRASKYFEGQLSRSPVSLREEERPVDIELLQEGESGHSGKEVKLVSQAITVSDIENPVAVLDDSGTESESNSDAEQEFVSSVRQETLSSAKKLAQPVPGKSIVQKMYAERTPFKPRSIEDPVVDAAEQLSKCKLDAQEKKCGILGTSQMKRTNTFSNRLVPKTAQTFEEDCKDNSSNLQVLFLGVSKKGAEQFKELLAKSKQPHGHRLKGLIDPLTTKSNLLERLRQTFVEWRTEETLQLLHCSSPLPTAHIPQHTLPANYEEEELDEDDFDSVDDNMNEAVSKRDTEYCLDQSLPFRGSSTATKPLPSYEKLKEETSQLELRVKEFYEAKFNLAEEDVTTQSEGEQHHCNNNDDQQWTPALPLVDSNAQQQIRKRIVLEKLQKVLPPVLGPLHIPFGDVYSELKNLIKTFKLTNTNIVHKIPVWTLIAIVLLSVLSQNIPVLAGLQQSEVYTQFLATLLDELRFKHEDFESLTRIFRSNW